MQRDLSNASQGRVASLAAKRSARARRAAEQLLGRIDRQGREALIDSSEIRDVLTKLVLEDPKNASVRAVKILNVLNPVAELDVISVAQAQASLRKGRDVSRLLQRAAEIVGGSRRSPGGGWGSSLESVDGILRIAQDGTLGFVLRTIAVNIETACSIDLRSEVPELAGAHTALSGPALKNPEAARKPALARTLMESMPKTKKNDWAAAAKLFALAGTKITRHEISAAVKQSERRA